ncbi:ABC transporter ATP-binding protein [Desulfofustis limnaeus]|jgi:iron complex transport system ATP-binding protein|uniref:ABC transporter ATP-binding protein n=1 Tax=Desulfofustis limnaeus TaxID=2740163 RepID=A0ABM7W6C5_9BACT|nr:ABC transporter ATP-binding protein [Desulfofustis limnaeus]MDX9894820.1 ABC transporter ATP-binding protein [Desulfofustis sp.]BDD86491.1 ABC transporter ATP-binding protein [Desulfofustis limnaeus]
MSIAIHDLAFAYNGTAVLERIDLTVMPGQLLAILGPNGVGKTTLLKCLNAIHKPSNGAILVEDRNVLSMKAAEIARLIGYVPQRAETARFTVFDTVLLGRKPHLNWRVADRDLRLVNSALSLLHMDHLALRYIDELSGGELQKVAIARALVQEPRLLLLDEPTASLDLKNQLHILSIIRRIVSEHKISAVMTMHDLNSALRYGDRFCFLKDGRIHSVSGSDELTPEVIEAVYGVRVAIHRIDNQTIILPHRADH